MDIEEIADKHPDALVRLPIDIRNGLDSKALRAARCRRPLPCDRAALVALLAALRGLCGSDAELMEINPLVADRRTAG